MYNRVRKAAGNKQRENLIVPAQMEAKEIDKFKSSLREVLLYIKHSKNKEQLGKLLETDLRFRLERRSYQSCQNF